MKPTTAPIIVALLAASIVPAQTPAASPNVRYVIGLDAVKRNATGKLTVQDGALDFKTNTVETKVPVSSIDDVFIGTKLRRAAAKREKS